MELKDYISQTLIAIGESYPFDSDITLDIGIFVCRQVTSEGPERELICVDENSKNRVKFTVHIGPTYKCLHPVYNNGKCVNGCPD